MLILALVFLTVVAEWCVLRALSLLNKRCFCNLCLSVVCVAVFIGIVALISLIVIPDTSWFDDPNPPAHWEKALASCFMVSEFTLLAMIPASITAGIYSRLKPNDGSRTLR